MSANTEAVRRLWSLFADGGLEAVLAVTDPDVVWYPSSARGRPLRGAEAVRSHFAALRADGVEFAARLDALEDLGDAVLARGSLRVERWGALSESSMVWLYRMRDGRVLEATAHRSRAEALAALAGASDGRAVAGSVSR